MKREELRALLAEAGIRPSKLKGQNFLVEDDLAEAIARDAEIQPDDVVLEIGTGLGILTRHLLARAGRVVTVETDLQVLAQARRILPDDPRLTFVDADVLASKSALEPRVLEAVRQALGDSGRLRVVSNLPYAIATPLVILLLAAELPLDLVLVMVQLEVAQRFAARSPEQDAYGAVSLLCAALCEQVKLVRRVPREVFHPRPKVSSAVVRLVPRPGRQDGFASLSAVVRGLFNFRRKRVLNAARIAARGNPALGWLEEAVRTRGLDPTRRVEALTLEEFRALAAARPPVE